MVSVGTAVSDGSAVSAGTAVSDGSVGSAGSAVSAGTAVSDGSVGSAGSAVSAGTVVSDGSVGSAGSAVSVGTTVSAVSPWTAVSVPTSVRVKTKQFKTASGQSIISKGKIPDKTLRDWYQIYKEILVRKTAGYLDSTTRAELWRQCYSRGLAILLLEIDTASELGEAIAVEKKGKYNPCSGSANMVKAAIAVRFGLLSKLLQTATSTAQSSSSTITFNGVSHSLEKGSKYVLFTGGQSAKKLDTSKDSQFGPAHSTKSTSSAHSIPFQALALLNSVSASPQGAGRCPTVVQTLAAVNSNSAAVRPSAVELCPTNNTLVDSSSHLITAKSAADLKLIFSVSGTMSSSGHGITVVSKSIDSHVKGGTSLIKKTSKGTSLLRPVVPPAGIMASGYGLLAGQTAQARSAETNLLAGNGAHLVCADTTVRSMANQLTLFLNWFIPY